MTADDQSRACAEIKAGRNVCENLAALHHQLSPLVGRYTSFAPSAQARRDFDADALSLIYSLALKYDGRGKFSTWVANAAKWRVFRLCHELRNKDGPPEQRKLFREYVEIRPEHWASEDDEPEGLDPHQVEQALGALSPGERKFLRVVLSCESCAHAAKKLRRTRAAVSARMIRVSRKLRRAYQRLNHPEQ